jgi:hypothetical protein
MLVLSVATRAYAFDWTKCREKRAEIYDKVGPLVAPTSTGQFTSSTGECAAIGSIEEKQKTFIAANYLELQKDIARGNGEYTKALAKLFAIDLASLEVFDQQLKRNYMNIFKSETLDLEPTYREIFSIAKKTSG